MSNAIGKRYAKALLDLAIEENKIDSFINELENVQATFSGSELLQNVICNPSLAKETQSKIIDEILQRMKLSQTICNLTKLLFEKKRLNDLPSVIFYYRASADEYLGRLRAEIRSPNLDLALSKEVKALLEKIFKKQILMSSAKDEELLGGMMIKVGDKLFDGSLRSQLDQIAANMRDGLA